MKYLPQVKWISTKKQLENVCKDLETHKYLAVDTEFLRKTTYYPKLSLIQLCGGEDAFLIDALSPDMDLTPLKNLLYNPNILKIFHAVSQDLEIFYNHWGSVPKPFIDTQILALFIGEDDNISYQKLCESFLGVTLSKKYQDINWLKRPLKEAEKIYAACDVIHLYNLFPILKEKAGNKFSWAAEEMKVYEKENYFAPSALKAWKRFKKQAPLSFDALKKLFQFVSLRDTFAQSQNIIPRLVIEDDLLMNFIGLSEDQIPPFLETLSSEKAQTLLALNAAFKAASPLSPETEKALMDQGRQNSPSKEKLQEKKAYYTELAQSHGLHPSLLTRTKDLQLMLQGKPTRLDSGWRSLLTTTNNP